MIVFSGAISEVVTKRVLRDHFRKGALFVWGIAFPVLMILCALVAFCTMSLIDAALFCLVVFVFGFSGTLIRWVRSTKKAYRYIWEYKYTVDPSKILVESPYIGKVKEIPLSKVKKVIEYRACYAVIGLYYVLAIFEKELLAEGSFEELEQIFGDKLVKKESDPPVSAE